MVSTKPTTRQVRSTRNWCWTTTGTELDGVGAYLGELANHTGLPAKVMPYHQVAASVVRDEAALHLHDGV
jgi:hypothetical protein